LHELDALVARLNATRVRPRDGAPWSPERFVAIARELGT